MHIRSTTRLMIRSLVYTGESHNNYSTLFWIQAISHVPVENQMMSQFIPLLIATDTINCAHVLIYSDPNTYNTTHTLYIQCVQAIRNSCTAPSQHTNDVQTMYTNTYTTDSVNIHSYRLLPMASFTLMFV